MQKYATFSLVTIIAIVTFIFIKNGSEHPIAPTGQSALNIAGDHLCIMSDRECTVNLDNQAFTISFVEPPQIEEESFVSVKSTASFSVEAGWIEGVNMYMGKTPVIRNAESTTSYEGLFFLGSCNLTQMEWQMTLVINKKTQPISVRFFTTVE
ncbi:hypothetical protein [Alteromonas facilis]|uniref:hypothetical protein n=1 Tax=Alteromonas facilis TaxID=2048004 RepID=UPI000F5C7C1F|nr:hypothetical protein [Alteromonas facilis]